MLVTKGAITAEDALRYAMSLPVAVTVAGMEKPEILQQNLKVAQNFRAMTAEEMRRLRESVSEYAGDGRFELYKVSLKYDNPEARMAHEFPVDTEQSEVKLWLGATVNDGTPYPEAKV
jgi:hypothetical protein